MPKKMINCPYPDPKHKNTVYKSTCKEYKLKSPACQKKEAGS